MKKDIEPYNIRMIDLVPFYGILTHASRTSEGIPSDGELRPKYWARAVGRAALLGTYQISVIAGALGLENLLLNSGLFN